MSNLKIGLYGNCQTESWASVIENIMDNVEVFASPVKYSADMLEACDIVFIQTNYLTDINNIRAFRRSKMIALPNLYFIHLFPDCIIEYRRDGHLLLSPAGLYNSSIILCGFLNEWSIADTIGAFNEDTFAILGFGEYWSTGRKNMIAEMEKCGVDGSAVFDTIFAREKAAYTINHPKLTAFGEIASQMLRAIGVDARSSIVGAVGDPLAKHGDWPLYPGVAPHIVAVHNFDFCFGPPPARSWIKTPIALDDFIAGSFEKYREAGAENIHSDRLASQAEAYSRLKDTIRSGRSPKRGHVYSDLPDSSYWQRAVARIQIEEMDAVVSTKFRLSASDRIATAGSCFAQHVAKALIKSGNNFFVTERSPVEMGEAEAARQNYGVFSARYGNLYTARQLLQLIRRALGEFTPLDRVWRRHDGRYVDPFRPQINPDGFETADESISDTERHLTAVRRLFEQMDVFVFTLGLTETWEAIADSAVFPVAPGVAAGTMDETKYCFKNFTFDEVRADLRAAIDLLLKINPNLRIVLTVSPVPLVATYEKRHVPVSTVYSKSVLRAVADEVSKEHPDVDYFPSYELIAGSYNNGKYFEPDKRSVSEEGVKHVMRIFDAHYLGRRDQETTKLTVALTRS